MNQHDTKIQEYWKSSYTRPQAVLQSINVNAANPTGPPAMNPASNPMPVNTGTNNRPSSSRGERHEQEGSKRDSDPIIQEKVRAAGHPQSHAVRSIAGRTQSLDITSLNFSRALTGGSNFGPMPPSPGVPISSPNTATAQYFPPSGQHRMGRGPGGFDAQLDSVTQGEHTELLK